MIFENQKKIEIAVVHDKHSADMAQLFYSLASVSDNSELGALNEHLQVNVFSTDKYRNNHDCFSQTPTIIYIGSVKEMSLLPIVWNQWGIEVRMIGNKAALSYHSSALSNKEIMDIKKFSRYVNNRIDKLMETSDKGIEALVKSSTATIDAWDAATDSEGKVNLPHFFRRIGINIKGFFNWVKLRLGITAQSEALKLKREALVKHFYITYLCKLTGIAGNV